MSHGSNGCECPENPCCPQVSLQVLSLKDRHTKQDGVYSSVRCQLIHAHRALQLHPAQSPSQHRCHSWHFPPHKRFRQKSSDSTPRALAAISTTILRSQTCVKLRKRGVSDGFNRTILPCGTRSRIRRMARSFSMSS